MTEGLLRVGTVNSVDAEARQVRVFFPDVKIVSGWLKVMKSPPIIPRTEATSGGSGESSFASHSHEIKVSPWMPAIDDTVLCVYDSAFNGDGYVLGAL